jgi:hypothetical protein
MSLLPGRGERAVAAVEAALSAVEGHSAAMRLHLARGDWPRAAEKAAEAAAAFEDYLGQVQAMYRCMARAE